MARAFLHAEEFLSTAVRSPSRLARDIWGTPTALGAPICFVSWVPPPPGFLKVNFDGNLAADGRGGGAGFVIRDHDARLVALGGQRIFDASVVCAELRAAWEGISYARRILHADQVILEGDSATVIDWIRGRGRAGEGRPLLMDIRGLLQACGTYQATHVYREANCAADWVAAYAAHHSGGFTVREPDTVPESLLDLLASDFVGRLHTRRV